MNERERFINALRQNEDDTTIRLVYADWLDEQGEHEEADRQRKWPAAKEWLAGLCAKTDDLAYDGYWKLSYDDLIEHGENAAANENGWGHTVDCRADERLCNKLRENPEEFWEKWSIVTGIQKPLLSEAQMKFTCSC